VIAYSYRKPHRYKRKKSILKNRFFWLGILGFAVFCGIFYFVFLSPSFQIKEIQISGNLKVSTTDIQNIILEQIEKKVLNFRTKSIFLIDCNKINKIILEKFPGIFNINSRKELPQKVIFEIEERKPLALFFQGESYFLLDKEGKIFETASDTAQASLKIENQNPKEGLKLGDKVIEKEDLSEILTINSRLPDLQISVRKYILVSAEKMEVLTDKGWKIYLNLQGDIDWQMTKLKAVLEEKIPDARRGDLEYIELRFGNLAPYKYRD